MNEEHYTEKVVMSINGIVPDKDGNLELKFPKFKWWERILMWFYYIYVKYLFTILNFIR